MTQLTLTKTTMANGVWSGVIKTHPNEETPQLTVTCLKQAVENVTVEPLDQAQGQWTLRIPIPVEMISDGLQTFLISDQQDGTVLGSFAIAAGTALEHDYSAELDLIRIELETLKQAFRRHCVETT